MESLPTPSMVYPEPPPKSWEQWAIEAAARTDTRQEKAQARAADILAQHTQARTEYARLTAASLFSALFDPIGGPSWVRAEDLTAVDDEPSANWWHWQLAHGAVAFRLTASDRPSVYAVAICTAPVCFTHTHEHTPITDIESLGHVLLRWDVPCASELAADV